MSRRRGSRVRPVTAGQLVALGRALPDEGMAALCVDARTWASAAQEHWGLCGVVLVEQEAPVAALLVTPALTLPVGHPLESFERQPGSAMLLSLVAPSGAATARPLVQGLCRRLVGHASHVAAAGTTATQDSREPALDVLLATGFQHVDDQHGPVAHLRLDLRRTLKLPRPEQAWQAVRGWVPQPVGPAEPTGRTVDSDAS